MQTLDNVASQHNKPLRGGNVLPFNAGAKRLARPDGRLGVVCAALENQLPRMDVLSRRCSRAAL